MIDGPHERFGDRGDGFQDALLSASCAGAVARNQRVIVAAHHHQIAQRGGFGFIRMRIVIEAEVFLRSVRQEVQESGSGFVLGVYLFRLLHHLQSLVIAASGNARGATFAQIGNEDGEDAAASRGFSFGSGKNRVDLLEGHGNFFDHGKKLALGFVRESVHFICNLAKNFGQRSQRLGGERVAHEGARALVDFR